MYISNLTHFLDDSRNIAKEMPKEARQLAGLFALVVDTTTKELTIDLRDTELKCFEKNCNGLIKSKLLPDINEIHWICTKCHNDG